MRNSQVTTFRPGDRVHLKGHAHTPATTGTVTEVRIVTIIFVRWDDNHTTTPRHPQHLELVGEPMSTDPRIEAAAREIEPEIFEVVDRFPDDPSVGRARDRAMRKATAALAAADNAATITTVEGLDALPGGTSILHDEGFQKLPAKRSVDDGHWYVTGSNEYRRAETLLPARVLRWGTE